MVTAKDIKVAPIAAKDARKVICSYHYSGKTVANSQLNLGIFLNGHLEGAMQFGPSMDKSKLQGLVKDTSWNGFIELNRMAFSDRLPRNSESRALSIAIRLIKKHYPHIQWIISFADATQCGDGAIYRAAGFYLTGIRKNRSICEFPTGHRLADLTITANWHIDIIRQICSEMQIEHKYRKMSEWIKLGVKALPGYQFRYLYFLDPNAKEKLTAAIIPFSKITDLNASMYKGEKILRG